MKRVIVLLARAPSARGKTRLTAHLSDADAGELRQRLLLDTLVAVRTTGIPVIISYTPHSAREEMSAVIGDLPTSPIVLVPQRGSGLGERMRYAIEDAFTSGAESVVLIGSDLPTLPPQHLRDAFTLLDRGADLVVGPSDDGGFYLVGACTQLPDIFRGIQWSTPQVCAAVVDAARRADLTVAYAPQWWDVDTPEDLRRL